MEKFYKKYKLLEDGYNVGAISIVLSEILLSKTRVVTISNETLTKNLNHHPDLTVKDYLLLDDIVGKSHFVAKDGKKTVAIVLNRSNKQLYHYVLKATKSGEGLFLTSFRKTRIKQINRLRDKGRSNKIKILKDNLP